MSVARHNLEIHLYKVGDLNKELVANFSSCRFLLNQYYFSVTLSFRHLVSLNPLATINYFL